MIAIIDYGIGNLGSVVKAFNYLDVPVKLTDDKKVINEARGVVLPGVGAFGEGMKNLRRDNLNDIIIDVVKAGKPFLGICLGLQLLFTSSQENTDVSGLNLIKGIVRKFDNTRVDKIPHMGWNQLELQQQDELFAGIPSLSNFYFVHSYFVDPDDENVVLARTTYGQQEFASVVRKDNIWGIQCHPEKSSEIGLEFLKNFSEVVG